RTQREASGQDAKADYARSMSSYLAMDLHGSAPRCASIAAHPMVRSPAARNLALAIGCVNERAAALAESSAVAMGFITISGWPNRGEVLSDRQPAFVRQAACQSRSNTRADRALLAVAVAFVVAVTVVFTVAIAIAVTIPVRVTISVMITFTEIAVT